MKNTVLTLMLSSHKFNEAWCFSMSGLLIRHKFILSCSFSCLNSLPAWVTRLVLLYLETIVRNIRRVTYNPVAFESPSLHLKWYQLYINAKFTVSRKSYFLICINWNSVLTVTAEGLLLLCSLVKNTIFLYNQHSLLTVA